MPVELYFPVNVCSCGELFKNERQYMKHQIKMKHSGLGEYTLVVTIDENGYPQVRIKEGVAHHGYKAKRRESDAYTKPMPGDMGDSDG